MRWHKPKHLDERIVVYFLLLPMKIKRETRWLERVTVKQSYNRYAFFPRWENTEFIDGG